MSETKNQKFAKATCTGTQLADALCLSYPVLKTYSIKGIIKKEKAGCYLVRDSVRGYIMHMKTKETSANEKDDILKSKARKEAALADTAEIVAQKAAGKLVPARAVALAWVGLVESAKGKLLSLPARLAPQCRAADTTEAAVSLILAEIESALVELARFDVGALAVDEVPEIEGADGEDEEEGEE